MNDLTVPSADVPNLPAETVEQLKAYARASRAENTQINYKSQWRAFTAWCTQHGHAGIPAAPRAVAAWLAERAQAGKSVATLQCGLAAIAAFHKLQAAC